MTLLEYIKNTLRKLIEDELSSRKIENAEVDFSTPNDQFSPPKTKITINVFLYDIRENLELRANNYIQNTKKNIQSFPTNVNFSYIITVWAQNIDDDYKILSLLIQILLTYPELPEFEDFKIKPLPKMQILNPTNLYGIGEFWQALKNNPKPLIHCTITAPVYPNIAQQYLVSNISTLLSNMNNSIKGEIYIQKDKINKVEKNKLALNISIEVQYNITKTIFYDIGMNNLIIYITNPQNFIGEMPVTKEWPNFNNTNASLELNINKYNEKRDILAASASSDTDYNQKIYYLDAELKITENQYNAKYKIQIKSSDKRQPLPLVKVKTISALQKIITNNGKFTFLDLPTITPGEYKLIFKVQDQQLGYESNTLEEVTDPSNIKVILTNKIKSLTVE